MSIPLMAPSYTPEQLNILYEKLPKELHDALFSGKTADTIAQACSQYGIEDGRVAQVAGYVGDVLMGILPPSEFEDALRKNVDLPEVLVKAISQEINRSIFYPVKAQLQQLHQAVEEQKEQKKDIGITTPRHSDDYTGGEYMVQPRPTPEATEGTAEPAPEPQPQEEKKPDVYREAVD